MCRICAASTVRFECFVGSSTIAPPTHERPPTQSPMVGCRWRPNRPDDWETDEGMVFLSKLTTQILRDNARRRYPNAWRYKPCMHFLDIDAAIEREFNDCFPGYAAVHECPEGNRRFRRVWSDSWALSRHSTYSRAEWAGPGRPPRLGSGGGPAAELSGS